MLTPAQLQCSRRAELRGNEPPDGKAEKGPQKCGLQPCTLLKMPLAKFAVPLDNPPSNPQPGPSVRPKAWAVKVRQHEAEYKKHKEIRQAAVTDMAM